MPRGAPREDTGTTDVCEAPGEASPTTPRCQTWSRRTRTVNVGCASPGLRHLLQQPEPLTCWRGGQGGEHGTSVSTHTSGAPAAHPVSSQLVLRYRTGDSLQFIFNTVNRRGKTAAPSRRTPPVSTRQAGSRAPHVTPWPGAGTGSRARGAMGKGGRHWRQWCLQGHRL